MIDGTTGSKHSLQGTSPYPTLAKGKSSSKVPWGVSFQEGRTFCKEHQSSCDTSMSPEVLSLKSLEMPLMDVRVCGGAMMWCVIFHMQGLQKSSEFSDSFERWSCELIITLC